jgi:hypothetical protein
MSLELIREKLEQLATTTDWAVIPAESGPVEVKHTDGSKLVIVDSIATSTLRLDYEPTDGNRAFQDDKIVDSDPENVIEIAEHIAHRHDEQN